MYRLVALSIASETDYERIFNAGIQRYNGIEWVTLDVRNTYATLHWYLYGYSASECPTTVVSATRVLQSTVTLNKIPPHVIRLYGMDDVDELQMPVSSIVKVFDEYGMELPTPTAIAPAPLLRFNKQHSSLVFILSENVDAQYSSSLFVDGTRLFNYTKLPTLLRNATTGQPIPYTLELSTNNKVSCQVDIAFLPDQVLVNGFNTTAITIELPELGAETLTINAITPVLIFDALNAQHIRPVTITNSAVHVDVAGLSGTLTVLIGADAYAYLIEQELTVFNLDDNRADIIIPANDLKDDAVFNHPGAILTPFSIYRKTRTGWTLASSNESADATRELYMALSTCASVTGLIRRSVITNSLWDFSDADPGDPVFLTTNGGISLVEPENLISRVVGWVTSNTSMIFDGHILSVAQVTGEPTPDTISLSRYASTGDYSYCGNTTGVGVTEETPTWMITRIHRTTLVVQTASNVAWTNRLTAEYV